MASQLIKRAFPSLLVIQANLNNKKLVSLLLTQPTVLCSLSEITHNILLERIELSSALKLKLKKQSKHLATLVSKQTSKAKKIATLKAKNFALLRNILEAGLSTVAQVIRDSSN